MLHKILSVLVEFVSALHYDQILTESEAKCLHKTYFLVLKYKPGTFIYFCFNPTVQNEVLKVKTLYLLTPIIQVT